MSDSCKTCGAAIRWVSMKSGKLMPLDATPEKRIVIRGPFLQPDRVTMAGEFAEVVDTYVSHFATCPDAPQHRKIYPDRGGRL